MPQRGWRGLAGEPVLPYVDFEVYAGSDCWLNLQFLDANNSPTVPTKVSYRIDCLTTDYQVLPWTVAPIPTTSSMRINFPASINIIGLGENDVGQTSQINQVTVQAIYPDNSQKQEVFVYEVIAVQTVGGV